jgi:hypothetical protein
VLVLVDDLNAVELLVYNTNAGGTGSLGQAISDNAALGGGNTIIFSNIVSGAIVGTFSITQGVTILGPGPSILAVDGNHGGPVFYVNSISNVTICGLTITNGTTALGGGIRADFSALTVSNCVITGNSVTGNGGGVGIIGNVMLKIIDCVISGNLATNTVPVVGVGGGVCTDSGSVVPGSSTTVMIANTLITSNKAFVGAGLYNAGTANTASVSNCTFVANASASYGGGIYNSSATLSILNSTIHSNTGSRGAGVAFFGYPSATQTVIGCTFSDNIISPSFTAGAVWNSASVLKIGNTILNRTLGGINLVNNSILLSLGYNLSSDAAGGYLNATGDQVSTNPILGPLANNSGPTKTMALRVGSPAINKGKSFGLATDQRGYPRAYVFPGVSLATGGDGSDIGAYEVAELQVTSVDSISNDLLLSFASALGTNYYVQGLSDLVTGSWTAVGGSIPGNGGIVQTIQTNALSQSQQFYRVQLPP